MSERLNLNCKVPSYVFGVQFFGNFSCFIEIVICHCFKHIRISPLIVAFPDPEEPPAPTILGRSESTVTLELKPVPNGSVRYSKYSGGGNTTTFNFKQH